MASGSIRFVLPSSQIDEVNVLLPEPLGPATTNSAGESTGTGRQFADDLNVRFARSSGLEADLKPRSVRQFLYIPPKIVPVNYRVAGGQSVLTGATAGHGRGMGKLIR